MEITKEQQELLNSFKCERLSENNLTKECIPLFESKRGTQLVKYLQLRGDDEDTRGITAFYIIRTKDNLPLAFFSLKCGLLFSPSMIESAESDILFQQGLIDALDRGVDTTNPDSIALFKTIEDLAIKRNCSIEEMINHLKTQASATKRQAIRYKTQYHDDEKTEADKPIFRVHITYPGIEIVHFCTNDNAKEYWKQQKISHTMGEVLFWWFILPKLQKVQKIVGCQYVYLFAADSSEDRSLINYYNVSLKFMKPTGIGTSKPTYDYCCEFLVQEINKLIIFRQEYFDNFNLDEGIEIV